MAAAGSAIRYFDFVVEGDSLTDEVFLMIHALRPEWSDKKLCRERCSEGGNVIYCYYQQPDTKRRDALMMRLYSQELGKLITSDKEFLNLQIVHAAGCFPAILASFNNGIIYQYEPGRPMKFRDLNNPDVIRTIVRKLYKLQQIDVESLPLTNRKAEPVSYDCTPRTFSETKGYLQVIPAEPKDETKKEIFKIARQKSTDDYLYREYKYIKDVLREVKLPISFCHGNFHPRNLIINDDTGNVMFIDYEMSGFHYAGDDMASLLGTRELYRAAGVRTTGSDDENISIESCILYATEYAKAHKENSHLVIKDASDEDVELVTLEWRILDIVLSFQKFVMGLACIDMESRKDVDVLKFVDYGRDDYERKREELHVLRDRYLALKGKAKSKMKSSRSHDPAVVSDGDTMAAAASDIRYFNFVVDGVNITDEVFLMIHALRPEWSDKKLCRERCSEGGNVMYCYYQQPDTKRRDALMMRLYSQELGKLITSDKEFLNLQIAHATGCFPAILASFDNGIIYQYEPGRPMKFRDLNSRGMIKKIVRKLYKLQQIDVESLPLTNRKAESVSYDCTPRTFSETKGYLQVIPAEPKDETKKEIFKIARQKSTDDYLYREYKYIKDVLREVKLPISFCHGNFHPRNLIINDETGNVTFIDYEMSGFHYAGDDMASLLGTRELYRAAGVRTPESDDENISIESCILYAREYAKVHKESVRGNRDVSDEDVELVTLEWRILDIVLNFQKFVMGLACVDMESKKDVDVFRFVDYGRDDYERKREELHALRDRYLELKGKSRSKRKSPSIVDTRL